MGVLFDKIRRAVEEGRFGFSNHADDMLRERSVTRGRSWRAWRWPA